MRFWRCFFLEKLKVVLCPITVVGFCGLFADLEAGASDELLVLKGRLFTDQENIYQALEDVRTTVVSKITSSQENTLALWLDSAPSGVSSPVGIFARLRMLSQVLDFWGIFPTTDPQAPSWSEVLQLAGVPRRAEKESLWGKIRQLRNTAHHLDTFVSVLGTPGDTSYETFFGLLNQVVKRVMNVPLLSMIESSCHQETPCIKNLITALLAEENKRLEEFVKSKNPIESEERTEEKVMIEKLRRYLVGFPKQKVSAPELLSTLFDNFFEILREYKFTKFPTFIKLYNELSSFDYPGFDNSQSSQGKIQQSFYTRLVDLRKSLGAQEFCLEDALDTFAPSLDSKLGQELQTLRGILADELFEFIGEESGNASAPTLRGFIDSLFNSLRRKNKLSKTNEYKNILLEHILDTAVTFENLMAEPLCLDIHSILKVFQEDCPEKLNEIFWLVDQPGSQEKQIVQKLEGGSEKGSLLGSLLQAKKDVLSFPLLRAFGSFPYLAYPQVGGQENFTSVLLDIRAKVREGDMTMNEARTECFGNADGSTHESLSYWLNILSSVFHSEVFDFSFIRNILPFLAYSEGSWLDRLIRLRDDYTANPSSQFETIQTLFPDVTVVLDYPQSQSFTRALWELMLEIFPIYFEKTFETSKTGVSSERRNPTSLRSYLESVARDWEEQPHEGTAESIAEVFEACRRWLVWLQKKGPHFSEPVIFSLYEHIGSPDNPAPRTLWREIQDMRKGSFIDPKHFSAACSMFLSHLQEIARELQGPRDGVRQFLQFCRSAISTLRQNLEGLIKLETRYIRQLEPLLTSFRNHLLSLYSGLMEGTMGEEITALAHDMESIFSVLSLSCPASEMLQPDSALTHLPQQISSFSEEIMQLTGEVAEFALKKEKSFSLFSFYNIAEAVEFISKEFLSSWRHYQPQNLAVDEQLLFVHSVESLGEALQQLSIVIKFL